MIISCDYRSESTGFVNTRFTEYGWRVAKREFIHSLTVYVCCQEDTFSVNHRRVIWSLREAGKASQCSHKEDPGSWKVLERRESRGYVGKTSQESANSIAVARVTQELFRTGSTKFIP